VKPARALIWFLILSLTIGCGRGSWSSGDRVLVAKFVYDSPIARMQPRRFDVVVFKYPDRPVENNIPKNYIKRLLGLPGQILAIFFGQLFFFTPDPNGPPLFDDTEVDPKKLWNPEYMKVNNQRTRDLFQAGRFEMVRKPPDIMMALRRIVYDNDFQAKDLQKDEFRRWKPAAASAWETQDHKNFRFAADKGQKVDWLRYRHVLRPGERGGGNPQLKPELITDFMGYNSFQLAGGNRPPDSNWVGDLMIECELKMDKAEGEFCLELSRGIDRFQAKWELPAGQCTLYRVGPDGKPRELDSRPTKLKGPGTHQVRFANFDARLTVWVDKDLPFGDGVDYHPAEMPLAEELKDFKGLKVEELAKRSEELAKRWTDSADRRGPTKNDLEPASIGGKGAAIQVQHLRLWRDTYYTLDARGADPAQIHDWSDPDSWGGVKKMDFKTLYVQPGHYLCLGDNSTASSDSRDWGLVPQRLMLGRALLVYYPLNRAGPIR
jgi:hypothetical protein